MDVAKPVVTTADSAVGVEDRVRSVIADYGRLSVDVMDIGAWDDLFRIGLTSHASVNVMLALEDTFDIEFPEAMLRKSAFQSVGAMCDAIDSLLTEQLAS